MNAIEPKRLADEELNWIRTHYDEWELNSVLQACLAHIAYLEARIAALEDAQPRVVPPGYFTGSDNDAGT